MSMHEMLMGSSGEMKKQAFEQLAAHYVSHGWNADSSSSRIVSFEAPADATPEQIAAVESGAATILASYGFGVC